MDDHILSLPTIVNKNLGNQSSSSLIIAEGFLGSAVISRMTDYNFANAVSVGREGSEDIDAVSKRDNLRADRGKTNWVTYTDYMADDCYWLTPGDALEFSRESAGYWALYLGNGLVVHIDTAANDFDSEKENSILTRGALALSSLNGVPLSARAFADLAIDSMSRNTTVPVKDYPASAMKLGNKALEASLDLVCSAHENDYVRIDSLAQVAGKDEFRVNNCIFMHKSHVERSFGERMNLVYEHVHQALEVFNSDSKDYVLYLRYKPKENNDAPPTDAWWDDD